MSEITLAEVARRLGQLERQSERLEERLRLVEHELVALRTGIALARWLGPMLAALGTGVLAAAFAHYLT